MPARDPSDTLAVEALILQARVAAKRQDPSRALSLLTVAVRRRPADRDALHARCQHLFEHGPPDEAEQALRDLAARFPDDAPTHHNLGSLYLRTGRYPEAAAAYRHSLRLRPDHAPTQAQLAHALEALDDAPTTATPSDTPHPADRRRPVPPASAARRQRKRV